MNAWMYEKIKGGKRNKSNVRVVEQQALAGVDFCGEKERRGHHPRVPAPQGP